jgi:hypothetical protein
MAKTVTERNWQSRRLPDGLRQEVLERIIIQEQRGRILVKMIKGKDF